eukprot:2492849-Rhodomonas_salina.1
MAIRYPISVTCLRIARASSLRKAHATSLRMCAMRSPIRTPLPAYAHVLCNARQRFHYQPTHMCYRMPSTATARLCYVATHALRDARYRDS